MTNQHSSLKERFGGILKNMRFVNKYANKIYKYIYIHSDETILLKDMAETLGFCQKTCRKYIKWLERRGYIKKIGKHFEIIPD